MTRVLHSGTRFYLSPHLCDKVAQGDVIFCDQVGKADIYVSRQLVIEINCHWTEEISESNFGRGYAYNHAILKYPRVANKLKAMRAMLWGETTDAPT